MYRYEVMFTDGWWEVRRRPLTKLNSKWEMVEIFRTHDEAREHCDQLIKNQLTLLVSNQAAEYLDDSDRDRVTFTSMNGVGDYAKVIWTFEEWTSWLEGETTHIEFVEPDMVMSFLEDELLLIAGIGKIKVVLPRSYYEV